MTEREYRELGIADDVAFIAAQMVNEQAETVSTGRAPSSTGARRQRPAWKEAL